MKNAEDVAVKILDDHWGICEGSDELQIAIAKSLQAAYQKGAEDMRIAAAKVAEKRCQCPHHISIGDEIRDLPLHPEGGGR